MAWNPKQPAPDLSKEVRLLIIEAAIRTAEEQDDPTVVAFLRSKHAETSARPQ